MANEVQVVTAHQMGSYLTNTKVRNYLEGILKERTGSFVSSMASIASMNTNLQNCTAKSLMMCGLKAASMNLPIDPNLGYAYPVPYKNNDLGITEAQFQMGYRGYIQLAMRTSQYKKLIVTDIRDGEIEEIDPITETYRFKPILNEEQRNNAKVSGYYAMFELVNGFRKEMYWPIEKLIGHGKRYSKSYHKNTSKWKTDEDSMCKKTMLRQLISKWGPMSVEMQEAHKADMAIIDLNEETGSEDIRYLDNPTQENQQEPEQDSPLNEVKEQENIISDSELDEFFSKEKKHA